MRRPLLRQLRPRPRLRAHEATDPSSTSDQRPLQRPARPPSAAARRRARVAIVAVPLPSQVGLGVRAARGRRYRPPAAVPTRALTIVSSDADLRDYRTGCGTSPRTRSCSTSPVAPVEGPAVARATGVPSGYDADRQDPTTDAGIVGGGGGHGGPPRAEPVRPTPGRWRLRRRGAADPADRGGTSPSPPSRSPLRVGEPGDTNLRKLSELTMLPSEKNPIVVFLGLSEDGNKALFLVSPSVNASSAMPSCFKGTDRCEFVEVERRLPGRLRLRAHGQGLPAHRRRDRAQRLIKRRERTMVAARRAEPANFVVWVALSATPRHSSRRPQSSAT